MDLRDGWNHCQYHNPVTNLWTAMPWDLDMLYMPVTHWSGVLNLQNSILQHAELMTEYRNRGRELKDLLFTDDQLGALVDEQAAFVSQPPAGGRALPAFFANLLPEGPLRGLVARAAYAREEQELRLLRTAILGGIERGSVASSPGGIDCGTDCLQHVTPGAHVTLRATAYPGSRLDGWTGACADAACAAAPAWAFMDWKFGSSSARRAPPPRHGAAPCSTSSST